MTDSNFKDDTTELYNRVYRPIFWTLHYGNYNVQDLRNAGISTDQVGILFRCIQDFGESHVPGIPSTMSALAVDILSGLQVLFLDTFLRELATSNAKRRTERKRCFFLACERGDLKMVGYLKDAMVEEDILTIVEKPTIPTQVYSFYTEVTPLCVAVMHGHLEVVEFLVQVCRVNVNEKVLSSNQNALLMACTHQHLNICHFLLMHGATDELDECAYYSIFSRDTQILRLLLQYGANPDKSKSNTSDKVICIAIDRNRADTLRVLLENGCSDFPEPLMLAQGLYHGQIPFPANRVEILRVLVQLAPTKQITKYVHAFTKHDGVCHDEEIVGAFFDAGAEIHCLNDDGETPILVALKHLATSSPLSLRQKSMVNFLIERGADPFIGQESNFQKCFWYVMATGDEELVGWILQKWRQKWGDTDPDGNYPLHWASKMTDTSYKSIQLLLEDAPAVDILDQKGRYPIQLACEHHPDLTVIFLLLQRKPDMLPGESTILPTLQSAEVASRG